MAALKWCGRRPPPWHNGRRSSFAFFNNAGSRQQMALRPSGSSALSSQHHVADDATIDGLPIAPSLGATLHRAGAQRQPTLVDRRVLLICALAIGIGLCAALIARLLTAFINLATPIAFYGEWSFAPV